MTSAAAVSARRSAFRDPVVLLPPVVGLGITVGWIGSDEHVPGSRIVVDLVLAWALAGASIVVFERPLWRRARWLIGVSPFLLLGADLEWARSPTLWTLGFLLEGAWAALLLQVVLTFPEERASSLGARVAIVGAYAATLAGQVAGALVSPDARDVLAVHGQQDIAHAFDRAQAICGVAVTLVVLFLVPKRWRSQRGPVRRASGPLFAATLVASLIALGWLGWVIAADRAVSIAETVARVAAIAVPLGVIAGVAWSRLSRPRASELVVELRTEVATMRERLARALGDPTLDVLYRIGDGQYVDGAGRRAQLPISPDRAVTPVIVDGDEIAALVHDPALLDDPALVESVRATASLVLENERLAAVVRSQLAEVRASRDRIVAAGDAERRRIERNLHDGAQQRLVTLSVTLGLEASRIDPAVAGVLARAQDEVEQAIAELRELARGIHPTLLRDEGLTPAVEALARRAPIPVRVESTVAHRLSDPVELAAYFVVSEALTNVVKHAAATEASVLLEYEQRELRVAVGDDGVGGAQVTPGSGLAGLRDRLEALEATLSIETDAGRGTIVRAAFPCAS